MRAALLILFLIIHFDTLAQIKWSDFDSPTIYTEEDGLVTKELAFLLEDKEGFLWIGSSQGVSRFDGSTFSNYTKFTSQEKSKDINTVWGLSLNHSKDSIYITSRDGVLTSSINSIEFKTIGTHLSFISHDIGNCKGIYVDKNVLWVGSTGKGLYKIDKDKRESKQFLFSNTNLNSSEAIWINEIFRIVPDNIDPDILWLGSTQGLIKFNKSTEDYSVYYYRDSKEFLHNHIIHIIPLGDKLHLGSPREGWFTHDKITGETAQSYMREDPNYFDKVIGFYLDNDMQLWVTYPQGLIQFDTRTNSIIKSALNDGQHKKIYGITLVDSRGLIWLTGGHGLKNYNPNPTFKFIQSEERAEYAIQAKILNIIKIGSYYYICPYFGSGIYKLNAADLSISTITIPVLPYRKNEGYLILEMIKMDDDNLMILGDKKVYVLNTKSDTFQEPSLQIPDSSQIYLQDVAKDKNNNYWLATNEDGLYQLNLNTSSFSKHRDLFTNSSARQHRDIKNLFVDSQNNLWIGQGSTSVLNLDTMSFECLNPDFNYEEYLPFGDFYEDNSQRIWVVNHLDGISYVSQNNIKEGLNKVVAGSFSGIYKYNDSLLWTIGAGKLGVLNTYQMSHQWSNITTKVNFTGPVIEMENGDYMIGCENGVIIYNPETHKLNQELPKPYVQELKANKALFYSGANFSKRNFTLPSGTKSLSIKISALAFQSPERISYHYKTDDTWIDLGASKEINLTNLRQGEYALELKAINSSGNSLEPSIYTFKIKPYWYTTNLALLFYMLLFGSIFYALYKFNLNRKLALAENFRAKEIDALKSKMYANISHEFRTPLTIIKGLSGMLLKKSEDTNDKDLIKGIDNSNDQLLNLVNQMLDLASLDANKMTVHYKNADVIAFIKKSVDLYRSYTDSKLLGLEFITDVNELRMDFDDDKLQKILNNLLSNAIKFTPHQGKITVQITHLNDILKIEISDTGMGVLEKDLPLIFDRYYKTHDKRGAVGTGIGLSLTKELVELLGGTINVKSKSTKGTSFIVNLPITNDAPETDIAHHLPFVEKWTSTSIDRKPLEVIKSHQNILLVEDNKEIQNFVSLMLSDNYNIIIAENGIQGLKIARNKDIDFIISDVMMPKMDGFEFCKNIKSQVATSHIPFVMVSARTHTRDKQQAYKLGVDAYLTKPFNPDELRLVIINILAKQKEREQHLLQLLSIKQPELESPSVNKLDLDLISDLQRIILGTSAKIAAADIAKKLLVSRSQLHRKVKSLTGKSLTLYANHIRIEKAKHLLRTSRLQIQEIAYSLGFESSTYFIRLFKKNVGVTPDNYRNTSL